MPVYGGTTELQTRLQRLPNLPALPKRPEDILEYLISLDRAITDFYGRLAERLQHFVEVLDTDTGILGAADTSLVVTFGSGLADTAFMIATMASWDTTIWVDTITVDGFTIHVSDAPGGSGGTIRWAAIR